MSIVKVKTVTIGLKGKKALAAYGISSRVVKIDASKSQNGCQYGIEFEADNFYEAARALRESGIEYGVYKAK